MDELGFLGNNITQKDKGLLAILEISCEMYKHRINFHKLDLYKSNAIKFSVEARKDGECISKEDLRIRSKVSKSVNKTLSLHGCISGFPETNQLTLF